MMEELLSFSYALLFIASFLIVKTFISVYYQRAKLPPGPVALPVIGHLHLLGPFLHQTFHKLSTRYGPLMYLRLGSVGYVVVSNPEFAKEILKTNELGFADRMRTAAITHLSYNASFAFAPYGSYWKFLKKFISQELLGNKTLAQFLPIRTKELRHFLSFVYGKGKAGESVNVTQELLKLTNNTLSQMMLSLRCSGTGNAADEVLTLVREVMEIFGEFNVSDSIWLLKHLDVQGFRKRFEDIHARYDALLERIITEREEERQSKKKTGKYGQGQGDGNDSEEVKDFLDMALDVFESNHSEMQLTRNSIKALILDLLTAGTDTSAIAIEWALAELINNPNVLKEAQKEIDQVVGKSRLVEESDTQQLPYIQAIIKETFRLHPPIPMIPRKSTKTCQVKGYTIPADCMVLVNTWGMGRDPKVWSAPLKFQPERFLNYDSPSVAEIDVRGLHYQLLPFGTGKRGCPGVSLAMKELQTTLAALVQCFEWKVVKGSVDMAERPGLSAPRAMDLECVPIARFTPTDDLFAA